MDKAQTAAFLKQIIGAYPCFEPTAERLEVWARNLAEIDYDLAIVRLDKHVKANRFPPTIADILNPSGARKKILLEESTSPAAIINGGVRWM